MKIKTLGLILIFISIIMGLFIYIFHAAVHEITNAGIDKELECTQTLSILEAHNNFHSKVSIFFSLILFFTGLYLTSYDIINQVNKPKLLKQDRKKELEEIKKTLTDEEILVFDEIIKSKGHILQTKLQEITKLNKVKITRVLTKLENKNIITRKRYGMTKMILLERRE